MRLLNKYLYTEKIIGPAHMLRAKPKSTTEAFQYCTKREGADKNSRSLVVMSGLLLKRYTLSQCQGYDGIP